jgi:mono/diheme cytochrome c family protein
MVYSLAYDSFAPNPITRDGLTLQRPVRGTIARGFLPLHYTASVEDAERAGRELTNPVPRTARSAADGKALFETYCAVCHGAQGNGDGRSRQDSDAARLYLVPRARDAGRADLPRHHVRVGKMPSYASQLVPRDRWLIVAHVQTLQRLEAPR